MLMHAVTPISYRAVGDAHPANCITDIY